MLTTSERRESRRSPWPATNCGLGGVVEQDAEDWWNAVCEATSGLPVGTGRPVAGFCGQMMGAVFLDESANSPFTHRKHSQPTQIDRVLIGISEPPGSL
jgi:sugar (pentulose or hexulose) kinase